MNATARYHVLCAICDNWLGTVDDGADGDDLAWRIALSHCEDHHSEITWPEHYYYTLDAHDQYDARGRLIERPGSAR